MYLFALKKGAAGLFITATKFDAKSVTGPSVGMIEDPHKYVDICWFLSPLTQESPVFCQFP